ncbi:hypothetical protein [Plastoroseomonas arctica]|uniref:Uncharacterized protein n=1 Tax=Plastoroseomonas arctica TaxID=1509237 RepID=A0AAF1KUN9_9PROT|nr:hypothetical protein [Plastoroseomonas arctica]MBR0656652.1 hypothetical protein [Plastoroseomonas arctica]
MTRHPATAIAQTLDAATYAGYRAGFEAARAEAAAIADHAGQAALGTLIRAMRALPDRTERPA